MRSRALQTLEEIMPAAVAPRQVDSNPFQEAIDGYERMKHEVQVLRNDIARKDQLLIDATRENDGLIARIDQEVTFYKEQAHIAGKERDMFARTCVEMATVNKNIGEAVSLVVNLTLRSQEIFRQFQSQFREESNLTEEMTATLEETLRNAGVPLKDRLPPNQLS